MPSSRPTRPASRLPLLRGLALVALLGLSSQADATVTQVDGTIVPVLDGDVQCEGNLQVCLDDEEGVSAPDPNALDAILDAQQLPEIFQPNTAQPVTFKDIAEGAGFENSFGYYNVGDDVTDTSNLHPIMGCGVPAAVHTGEAGGYFVDAEAGDSTTVDFAAEASAGRYAGGFIGFYLIAPEGHPNGSTDNCGDFAGGPISFFGRIYFTQRDLNNDGDFVHHLVYASRLATDRFYFGFEDLFRGGDNDFEDMAMQVTGLTPPCQPSTEICNGIDDDCDGLVDNADPTISDTGDPCDCDGSTLTCEGGNRQGVCISGETACVGGSLLCRSTTAPSAETCNTLDDNCDGSVDNNTTDTGAACDGSDADLCEEGVIVCSSGVLTCNDTTGANVEICNLMDDDCDSAFDEDVTGVGVSCDGSDGDLCLEGVTACVAGTLTCDDTTPTNGELCNGSDDDCDTTVDENPTDVGDACTVGVGACARSGATRCSGGSIGCNVSPGTPQAERCNALDDDCDGPVDEDYPLGQACMALGECGNGVFECAGAFDTRCSTAPGGSMDASTDETCNGLDDDCDGVVDEGLTDLGPCGTDTGECEEGRLRCLGAAPTCVGGIGPIPETCNNLDDDCDGDLDNMPVDEGGSCGTDVGECSSGLEVCVSGVLECQGAVGPAEELCDLLDNDCDLITDEMPTDVGADCGTTDVGVCDLGATICVDGEAICAGATEPSAETCNGDDDDCDGTTDEEPIDIGRVCGSAMGTCTPGMTVCTNEMIECEGATPGEAETCNGIDDDCDTVIDEDPTDEGGDCGMEVGVCELGGIRCIAGALECFGGVLPGTEVCNGLDDDCDGELDEGPLCEGGVCANARCSLPCVVTEFGGECPRGETCVDDFCVEDRCFDVSCMPLEDGSATRCDDGECVRLCDTVSCEAPNVCRRTDGACVGNNCIFLPDLCTDGEVCDAGECIADPCAGVSCEATEFCREGACVGSCSGVDCGLTEVCRGGECEPSGCLDPCDSGEVCTGGSCGPNPCAGVRCETGGVCDPSVGECVDDPCRNVICPEGQACSLGECDDPPQLPDGGVGFDGGGTVDVLAAGGSFCSASATAPSSRAPWLMLLTVLGLFAVRRRRQSRGGAEARFSARFRGLKGWLGALVLLGMLTGCEVDPYCIRNCPGDPDGSVDEDASAEDADVEEGDAGEPDACVGVPGAEEVCNESDDDCDGFVDEEFDLTRDNRHCGACDNSCARDGAQTRCTEDGCEFVACFDGFVDLDGDTGGAFEDTNGCEYQCFESNGGEEACDTIDNDCDGQTDETFDLQVDDTNCGQCGRSCSFFRVDTASCQAGVCAFDRDNDCTAGFLDQNGVQSDGCEFECTPRPDNTEICNGLDDDCDTRTDEDFDLDSNVQNCGRCGRVCSFPNATPSCTTGTCGFDPNTDCDAGFSDRDGVQLNGCEYPCTPTADPTEICDGLDNDCNGRVDGPTTDSGGACNEAPSGTATGICTDTGVIQCVGTALVCAGAPEPVTEVCNNLDDDCDGTIDDSPNDVGRVCQPAVGTCTAGFTVCNAGGSLDCERAVGPVDEVCNGLDDDCDGTTDEDLTDPGIGMPCGVDTGECVAGVLACDTGSLVCAGEVGQTLEVCNGLDDDCDGTADDDPVDVGGPCGSDVGACVPGSEVCSAAGTIVCSGGLSMTAETCDSDDNDCDGATDESLTQGCYSGPPMTRNIGQCSDGTQTCVGGSFGSCGGEVLPSVETCDDTDEDCDNSTDEGVTQSCYGGPVGTEGVGICRPGTQACSGGVFSPTCVGDITPEAGESCDSEDDDCDGAVDEAAGGGALTQSCYSGTAGTAGVGTCVAGTQTCRFGAFDVCSGEVVDTVDRCGDGLDTDCDNDGDIAEGCLVAGSDVRLDTGDGNGATHSFDVRLAWGGSPTGRNVYAVWTDKRNGAGAADIFFSRSTNGGDTWSAPTDLTSGTGLRGVKPEIAVGRSGSDDHVFVAYQLVDGSDVRQIHVRRSTNSGSSFSGAERLDTTGSTDNFKHSIATNLDGSRVVVAWEQLRTDNLERRVLSRASSNSGSSYSGERLVSVNVGANPTAGEPVVAVTDNGRFVFAWREARPPARPTFDVYATFSDTTGDAIPSGREERLDGDTAQNRASDDLRIGSSEERVYVAWTDVSTVMGGGADIVFSRTTNGGGAWSTEVVIDDPGGMLSDSADATLDVDPGTGSNTDDRVFIAWQDTRDGTQIYTTVSTNSGASFAPETRATSQADGPVPGVCQSPSLVYAGGDAIVIAYANDANGSATNRRVYAAASIDGGLTWQITDPLLDSGGGEAVDPAIARVNGNGLNPGAAVAWVDFRAGTHINGDIYRARVGE